MTTINVSIDDALAKQFSENCRKKGLTAQDAIVQFIKKSGRKFRFPFFRKTSLADGKSAFDSLRNDAQQSGKSFYNEEIENVISEIRAKN